MDQEMLSYLKEQFLEIRQQIGSLGQETRERFEKMDERFEKMDERFETMDERFDRMEGQIEGLREESREGIRHTRVLLEDVQGNVRLLAEGVSGYFELMGKLEHNVEKKLENLWDLVSNPFRHLQDRVTRLEEVEDRRQRDIMEVIQERILRMRQDT